MLCYTEKTFTVKNLFIIIVNVISEQEIKSKINKTFFLKNSLTLFLLSTFYRIFGNVQGSSKYIFKVHFCNISIHKYI